MLSEVLMLPVFLYWFYLVLAGKTKFPKRTAIGNVLVFYGILYVIKSLLCRACFAESAFRLGFTNGLMSESMSFFFLILWMEACREQKNV